MALSLSRYAADAGTIPELANRGGVMAAATFFLLIVVVIGGIGINLYLRS